MSMQKAEYKNSRDGNALVVGGGLAGLLSAYLLRDSYEKITLVEQTNKLGGLLQSNQSPQGDWFDFGTHFMSDTGIAELDNVLYGGILDENWHEFEYFHASSFTFGEFNEFNCLANINGLDRTDFCEAVVQLISCPDNNSDNKFYNLEEQLLAIFGTKLVEVLFRPSLFKLYGTSLKELAPDAHKLFGLVRITGLDPETTRQLKFSPTINEKLNHYKASESPSKIKSYYPKTGGINRWVSGFQKKLESAGVRILKNTKIVNLSYTDDRVTSATFSSGEKICFDEIVWTVPPIFAINALGKILKSSMPEMRSTYIVNLSFDRPFQHDTHWCQMYDPQISSFRGTFYSNIQPQENRKSFPCSLEIVSGNAYESKKAIAAAVQDLRTMKLISTDTNLLYSHCNEVKFGFPVLSTEFIENLENQKNLLRSNFSNLVLLGKASGKAFFMTDVMIECFEELKTCKNEEEPGRLSTAPQIRGH